jgi:poly(hydroxyalkanoate) depolymerase family esterase
MRPLSDTIARLAAMKARAAAPLPKYGSSRLVPLKGGGSNPGSLKAKLFAPSRPAANAALVVVLHGCTQTADGYDHGSGWSKLAEEQGFFVLFPEQQRANNPNLCFNWFLPEHTQRGQGEALSIRQMIEEIVATHDIDGQRVFITGLSAGGAMAAAMLAIYPDVFAGGAIIAGLAYGVAKGVPEAFDRMRGHALPPASRLQANLKSGSVHRGPWPSISIWQGTADSTVHAANANAIVDQWREVHRLEEVASATRKRENWTTMEWSDRDGQVKVTLHGILGMGHGTPLATKGPDLYGHPGPYMLDVGISSTYEIAKSWGLIDRIGETTADTRGTEAVSGDEYAHTDAMPTPSYPFEPAPTSGAAAQTGRIGDIIGAALRSAGLMK